MNRIKGILYAAVSSATFGLAPFFSISLLAIGYSSFEVLTYRWGVATVVLLVFAFLTKCDFHIGYKDFKTIFGLSLLRALTSSSLLNRSFRRQKTFCRCYAQMESILH